MWEEIGTFPLEADERSAKIKRMKKAVDKLKGNQLKSVPLEKAMSEILEMACPATTHDAQGWANYYIETHCIMWTVTAKKENGEWIIKMCTGEAC